MVACIGAGKFAEGEPSVRTLQARFGDDMSVMGLSSAKARVMRLALVNPSEKGCQVWMSCASTVMCVTNEWLLASGSRAEASSRAGHIAGPDRSKMRDGVLAQEELVAKARADDKNVCSLAFREVGRSKRHVLRRTFREGQEVLGCENKGDAKWNLARTRGNILRLLFHLSARVGNYCTHVATSASDRIPKDVDTRADAPEMTTVPDGRIVV
jgi:hypothetical protein